LGSPCPGNWKYLVITTDLQHEIMVIDHLILIKINDAN
jgi:hypothetical protein